MQGSFFLLLLLRETVTYMFNTNVASQQMLHLLRVNAYKLEVLLGPLNAHISDKTITIFCCTCNLKWPLPERKHTVLKVEEMKKREGGSKAFPFW